jgi:hypothetical protein
MLAPFVAFRELKASVPVIVREDAVLIVSVPVRVTFTPDILNGWFEVGIDSEDGKTFSVSETPRERLPLVAMTVIA